MLLMNTSLVLYIYKKKKI